jgi:NAD(P)-dependent dehydrogenase (short-subunit alcohol dehydrogenase family)
MRAIVTGAGSGIGEAVARRFAQDSSQGGEAAELLLVDMRADAVLKVAESLSGIARVATLQGDLGDPDFPERIVSKAEQAFGGIDVVVSNAAVNFKAALEDFTVDQFDRTFAVNTRATWLLAKAARPLLARSRGSVIAIASIAGDHPGPGVGAYSVSKAALIMLIRQMALEWGGLGIRFNCISPGTVVSGLSPERYVTEEQRELAKSRNPLGILGMPEHISGAVAFLAGPDASYINGSNLIVDGGKQTMLMKS